MNSKFGIIAMCLLLATAGVASANPVTLTFEGVPNTIYGAPITRSGYDIGNVVGDEQHFHEIDSTAFPGFIVSNGTGVLYNDRDTRIFVDLAASSPYSSFMPGLIDLAAVDTTAGGATNVAVEGFLGGFSTGVVNVPVNFSAYNTIDLSGLGRIDRMVFDANGGGGFSFDNLNLTGIPEPSTMMLLGMGVLGIAGVAVRRRRTNA